MPMYEEECPTCGSLLEYYSKTYNEETQLCACGALMERRFSIPAVQIWEEYTTRDILPDGVPVTVTSAKQESRLLKENGLIKADSSVHGGPK